MRDRGRIGAGADATQVVELLLQPFDLRDAAESPSCGEPAPHVPPRSSKMRGDSFPSRVKKCFERPESGRTSSGTMSSSSRISRSASKIDGSWPTILPLSGLVGPTESDEVESAGVRRKFGVAEDFPPSAASAAGVRAGAGASADWDSAGRFLRAAASGERSISSSDSTSPPVPST